MEDVLPKELSENLIEFCINRAHVYALLARCFEKEIDAGFAQAFSNAEPLISDKQELTQCFAKLQAGLDACDDDKIEQLAVIFDRVFFGMGPLAAKKAFPYESVYTSSQGLMMQDAFAEVQHVYAHAGFKKNPDVTEPDDHIAVELAFMECLCNKATEALKENDAQAAEAALKAQMDFLNTHLLNWVSRFATDARNASGPGFYADLAIFADAYLKADVEALSEVVD